MNPMRVLIVDDEEELVQALVERLKLRRIDAEGVTSGAAALDAITCTNFDVILIDVKMPGLGGIELVKRIKEHCPGLQVVLLTGHSSRQDADEGMRLGAFDYLMKPVRLENLLKTLEAAAGRSAETSE
ncbi:MAG: response regulator [Candidatus Eiseniibacteriota bacterium]|jgi:DNA-binding NtrC family response regulator